MKAANFVPGPAPAKNVGPALTCSNEPDGTNTKVKKASALVAITCVLQNGNGLVWDESTTSVEENANDAMSEPSKKKCKKGSGAADILTVFKFVDADDPSQGYICKPCA